MFKDSYRKSRFQVLTEITIFVKVQEKTKQRGQLCFYNTKF